MIYLVEIFQKILWKKVVEISCGLFFQQLNIYLEFFQKILWKKVVEISCGLFFQELNVYFEICFPERCSGIFVWIIIFIRFISI
jgi:hypothetical protein